MANGSAVFLGQFLRSPAVIGAVAPSSRRLSAAMCVPVPDRGDPVVVELGPGTGSFTGEIRRRLAGRGRHLAVEISPRLAGHLTARHPGVELVVGDAAHLPRLLAERGVTTADVVVSGLPWAAFSPGYQTEILRAVLACLTPLGAFTTFSYRHAQVLPSAMRFRRALAGCFEEVVVGRTVWRNLPPAFVYHARRPRQ